MFEIFIWLSHQREKLLSTLMGIELGFACSLNDHTWVCTLFLGYAFFSLVSLSYVILYWNLCSGSCLVSLRTLILFPELKFFFFSPLGATSTKAESNEWLNSVSGHSLTYVSNCSCFHADKQTIVTKVWQEEVNSDFWWCWCAAADIYLRGMGSWLTLLIIPVLNVASCSSGFDSSLQSSPNTQFSKAQS